MNARRSVAGVVWIAAWLVATAPRAVADIAHQAAAVEPWQGDYRTARWTTAEGLPQNTINDIRLLPSGELWLATFGGLARFDGRRFTVVDMAADDRLPATTTSSPSPSTAATSASAASVCTGAV